MLHSSRSAHAGYAAPHTLKAHWPKPLLWPFTFGHEIGGVIAEKGRYLGFDKAPHLRGGWAEYVYVGLDVLPGTKVYKLPDDMSLRFGRCQSL
jgi:hypothetical protein